MEEPYRINPSFPNMTRKEWQDLWNRLRLFTYKYFSWIPQRYPAIDLQEVIIDAIEDTWMGKRQWFPPASAEADQTLALFRHLCFTIRSKLSHLVEKRKRLLPIEGFQHGDHAYSPRDSELQRLRVKEQPDELAMFNELCRGLLAEIGDDPTLRKIVELWISDPQLKPRDIADLLDLSPTRVYAAQRRLQRRLRRFKERCIHVT